MYFSPKSKNLYIIGNGFDLYLGLKTSYNDFFKNKNYISIRKDIQNKIDSISLLKSELENKNEIDRNFNNSKIGIYNLFLLYLLLEEDNKTVNWNDVEKKILPAAKKIQESLFRIPNMRYYDKTEIRNRIVEKIIDRKSNNKELDFLKELNKFEKEFGNYIAQINNDLFDIGMGTFKDKIHGTFENPIFGIDNTEIGNDREFYYLTKTSRVLFNNTIKEEFKLPNKIEISKICFFGHSLARADYSYFQSIFDYYDIYNSEVKLEFKYYNYIKDKKELTDEQKEERKDEVKSNMHKSVIELMNDYGNTASNKSRGKNLLHKLILENRIKILEVE